MTSNRVVSEPTLRLATIEDLDAIVDVHTTSREAAYRGWMPDGLMDYESVEDRRSRWYERLVGADPRTVTWVAELVGRIVGFCHSGPETLAPAGPSRHIHSLYIAPGFQALGLGRSLLERTTAMIAAAGVPKATLHVYRFNEPAQRFYEHLGWVRTGTFDVQGPDETQISGYRYGKRLAPKSTSSTLPV